MSVILPLGLVLAFLFNTTLLRKVLLFLDLDEGSSNFSGVVERSTAPG